MNVQLKVGSVFRLPAFTGGNFVSVDPSIANVTTDAKWVTLTAVKVGVCQIVYHFGSDVSGVWVVSVVAS